MATQTAEQYFYGVGRRKRSTARAKVYQGSSKLTVTVNGKDIKDYWSDFYRLTLENMLELVGVTSGRVELFIKGGGIKGQVEAARLAVSKALLKIDEGYRPVLRANGFLTTDIRIVLPKRPGLRKARKAEQWSKR